MQTSLKLQYWLHRAHWDEGARQHLRDIERPAAWPEDAHDARQVELAQFPSTKLPDHQTSVGLSIN